MIKLLASFVLLLSLLSCGKDGDSSSTSSLPLLPSSPSSPSDEDSLSGTDPDYSPRGLSDKLIVKNEVTHAPMNFLSQNLTMTFDPTTQKVTGHSLINFKLKHTGRPYFELQGTLKNVKVNQSSTNVSSISDPDGQNQNFWSINQELPSDDIHVVEFDYEIPSTRVSFVNGGVRFLTDMTDLSGKFFEYWGPVGFEEDAFTLNLILIVANSTSVHKLYTNGKLTSSDTTKWQITFPHFYSKSSFYVHLTNQTLPSQKFVYKGLEKDIPVEVYGLTSTLVSSAVAELPKLFKELEKDYGPYPHDKFLAYMNDRSGGMEYVAATITSLASIDHELLHSWFARSVIPADGRSGWIDEAIASWRDYGYTRATSTLKRNPTNLANFSPFRKTTPSNSYVDGRGLMAELDLEFSSLGGMKTILRAFFEKYKNRVVNNEEFWDFLELHTNMNVDAFHLRYALGNSTDLVFMKSMENAADFPSGPSKHPTPLTEEEVLRLR